MDRGISRRALLGGGAGLAATAAIGLQRVPGPDAAGEAEAAMVGPVAKGSLLPPERIGLQLYSVREAVADLGFAKVFETLAEIGFKQVEFAGYTQGSSPEITLQELRALLDANGLVGAGSHVSPSDDASMEKILDDAQVLGIPRVGLSLLTPAGPPTTSGWKAAAERYNHYGEIAARRGFGFYLHNHFQEWLPTADNPNRRGMDVLFEETDPRLVDFQIDIFWAHVGRAQSNDRFDPLKDYVIPNLHRIVHFHVKDGRPRENEMTDVGEGEIDFQSFFDTVFAQATDQRDRHVYLWERDNAAEHPRGPLAAARSSFVNMRYGLFVPAAPAPAPGAVECAPPAGFTASVVRTGFRRTRTGRRVLRVTLKLGGPADVSARLVRGRRTLAARSRRLEAGTRTVDLALPRAARRGGARLDLTVSNGAGVSLRLRDRVRVPRRAR